MSEWPVPGTHPVSWAPKVATPESVSALFEPVRAEVRERGKGGGREKMLAALDDSAYVRCYVECASLVARLVGSELDTETPGNRGMGRITAMIPRLGGRFRSKLEDEERQAKFGLLIEETIVACYATAVALYQLARADPPQLVDRSEEDVWRRWIPRSLNGLHGAENRFTLAASATEHFYAEGKKDLLGPFSLRRKMSLSNIINFYITSGAALFEVNTTLAEDLLGVPE